MPKFVSIEEAVKLIPDGASIMFGGFMGCGNAHKFIDALSKSGVKDLTMICNDGSMPGGPMGEDYYGVAKLIHNKQVKKLIATHVGLNPEVAQQSMQDGTLEVVLIPQGSLAEMIRADAADTVIAEAEQVVEIGDIAPEDVRTSGVFVDYVVEGGLY